MPLRLVAVTAVAALLLLLGGLWWTGEFRRPLPEAWRELAHYRVERRPAVPAAWWQTLEQRLQAAPPVSLLDPQREAIIASYLAELPWVDPASVVVQPRLPEGWRVLLRPRQPDLVLLRGGQFLAALDGDGTVLPEGLPPTDLTELLALAVGAEFELPPAGRRVADPLLHEALAVAGEAYALRREFGLPIARLERQPGYPEDAPAVPPALNFVLADGRLLQWGRSAAAGATLTPALAEKHLRLRAVLAQYPDLAGVHTLILDRDPLRALDANGQPLPLAGRRP